MTLVPIPRILHPWEQGCPACKQQQGPESPRAPDWSTGGGAVLLGEQELGSEPLHRWADPVLWFCCSQQDRRRVSVEEVHKVCLDAWKVLNSIPPQRVQWQWGVLTKVHLAQVGGAWWHRTIQASREPICEVRLWTELRLPSAHYEWEALRDRNDFIYWKETKSDNMVLDLWLEGWIREISQRVHGVLIKGACKWLFSYIVPLEVIIYTINLLSKLFIQIQENSSLPIMVTNS